MIGRLLAWLDTKMAAPIGEGGLIVYPVEGAEPVLLLLPPPADPFGPTGG